MGLLALLSSRKRADLSPVVRDLLEQAILQRSTMQVEFTDAELTSGRFAGPCVKFDEKTVFVDVALHKHLSELIGEEVRVSFKTHTKRTSSYYQFTSQVHSLPRCGAAYGITLAIPEEIRSNQKRSFVRITPRKEAVYGIGVWEMQPARTHRNDPDALGAAQVSFRQDHQKELALLNVSAGGLSLKVQRPPEDQPAMDPQPGDRLLCLLMLAAPEGEPALSLWLESTVVNRRELENDPCAVVGLRFDAWAAPAQDKGGVAAWFGLGEDGAISALATWIVRHQLQQLPQSKAR